MQNHTSSRLLHICQERSHAASRHPHSYYRYSKQPYNFHRTLHAPDNQTTTYTNTQANAHDHTQGKHTASRQLQITEDNHTARLSHYETSALQDYQTSSRQPHSFQTTAHPPDNCTTTLTNPQAPHMTILEASTQPPGHHISPKATIQPEQPYCKTTCSDEPRAIQVNGLPFSTAESHFFLHSFFFLLLIEGSLLTTYDVDLCSEHQLPALHTNCETDPPATRVMWAASLSFAKAYPLEAKHWLAMCSFTHTTAGPTRVAILV